MIFQANWIHPAITDENAASNGKVTCVPFPVIDGAKGSITEFSGGTSDGYYINANCKHPREAVEYLEYLSRKIGTVGYSMGAGLPFRFPDDSHREMGIFHGRGASLLEG